MTNTNQLPRRTHAGSPRWTLLLGTFSALVACTSASALPASSTAKLAPGDKANGADNFYASESVNIQKVTFKNQYKMNVVGNLFVPKDLKASAKTPAIVVGHPMGAVKEQSANLYATKMAE